jgi:ion channel-forming bestrophin family protein
MMKMTHRAVASSWRNTLILLIVVLVIVVGLMADDSTADAFVLLLTPHKRHAARARNTLLSRRRQSQQMTISSASSASASRLQARLRDRLKTAVNIPPGEAQRKFRRTIYTSDDWVKHRSQNRFVVYLAAMWKSGMYKNLCQEVLLTTSTAALTVYYNAIVGGYTGFGSFFTSAAAGGGPPVPSYPALIQSDLFSVITLPLSLFYLTSPAMSLLLVFRMETSYRRWDVARKYWQLNINHTRDLLRMANAYYDYSDGDEQRRQEDLHYVALCTWAFCRAMKRHLSPDEEDEIDFQRELYETLVHDNNNNNNTQLQADMIIAASHRPNRALQDLSFAIDSLPMHFLRKHEIHQAVSVLEDNLGSCEVILSSPVPLMYSRHLARFLVVWLMLLPLGLYETFETTWNHIMLIPVTTIISIMLFGIEEIATQLAEPFTILPMQSFCDKIYNGCMEIASWTPGDHGRAMRYRSSSNTKSLFPVQQEVPLLEQETSSEYQRRIQ